MKSILVKSGIIIVLTLPALSAWADMSRISHPEVRAATSQTEDMSRISKTTAPIVKSTENSH
jgi:hypothetical protein